MSPPNVLIAMTLEARLPNISPKVGPNINTTKLILSYHSAFGNSIRFASSCIIMHHHANVLLWPIDTGRYAA